MPRVRVHQHVNPLAPYFRFAPKAIEIEEIFARPNQSIHLDIGSARGRFLLKMAEIFPARNFLGVEIREPLVAEANRLAREANLTNLHYKFCNATFALDKLLEKFPAGILQTVTIQFPDPWYKKRHAKRRMVNNELIKSVVRHLRIGGQVYIQTDVDFLAEEMFEMFRGIKNLREMKICDNPFPVKTERENAVEEKGLPVYRARFEKI